MDMKQEYVCNDDGTRERSPLSFLASRARRGLPSIGNGHQSSGDQAELQTAIRGSLAGADWFTWGAARDGARVTLTRAQILWLALLAGLAIILAYASLHNVLIVFMALMSCAYLLTGLHKARVIMRGERAISNDAGHPPVAEDDDLPQYTVLVALHREGRILPVLVQRLAAIDYPPTRLEILLLIESDDIETQHALDTCALPTHIQPVIVPPGQPRTKPRALNVGLARATGDYIVIYDAEDRPEPDQLRKAVAAFHAMPADVICVQARLNFYNWRQSILATVFAVDYTAWYDLMLPGLTQASAFVPLGGTSNHFRIEALQRLGGWDPFNVTEDCDLGVRIARSRLHIAMLDSTTWEEAVPRIQPWVKQRSRWVKGYLQTYLVHMRHPLQLYREMGPGGFADFQLLVGAQSLVLLLNPVVWLLTVTYALNKGTRLGDYIQSLFPGPLYYLALLSFVFGNFVFLYINLYVCVRRGYDHLARYALLSPVYWVLMSIGAWTGFISLIRHPHYWAKTEHGVSLSHGVHPHPTIKQLKRLGLLCLALMLACLAVLSREHSVFRLPNLAALPLAGARSARTVAAVFTHPAHAMPRSCSPVSSPCTAESADPNSRRGPAPEPRSITTYTHQATRRPGQRRRGSAPATWAALLLNPLVLRFDRPDRRAALHVVNLASAPVTLASVRLSGPGRQQFVLLSDTCTGRTLAPDTGCLIRVGVRSRRGGPVVASVVIAGRAGQGVVSVPVSRPG